LVLPGPLEQRKELLVVALQLVELDTPGALGAAPEVEALALLLDRGDLLSSEVAVLDAAGQLALEGEALLSVGVALEL
jgi:hypothetical protein